MSQAASPSGSPRILIVRLSALGDVIHGLPVACALRAAMPHATIGWVVEGRNADLSTAIRRSTTSFAPARLAEIADAPCSACAAACGPCDST